MTNNKFITADEQGRTAFKSYCTTQPWCKVHKESKDEFAAWDISYYSGSTMIIGEIKQREYNSTAFDDWDYETKKHNALLTVLTKMQKKYPNNQIEIQYINIYKDDKINIWTTTNTHNEQQPITLDRPTTTMGNQADKVKALYKCYSSKTTNTGTITNKQNQLA